MTRPVALLMAGVLLLFYVDGFVLGAPLLLLLAFALLGLPVLAGFLHHGDHGPAGAPHPRPVLLAAAGALLVLALSRGLLLSVVLAAALVGCVGALLERLSRGRGPWRDGAAPIYCGAFAGMTSELVLRHPGWVLLAGALAGLLFALLGNSWRGIGGKLGSTAFLAVALVCALAGAVGALGAGAHLHNFTTVERALLIAFALVSPLLTHWLSYPRGFGAVLGSALPSLVVALVAPLPLAAVWLGASFVGMTSPDRLPGRHPQPGLLAMGLMFGLFSLGFEPRLAGLGGDLGATAAVSVFAVLGAHALLSGRWPGSPGEGGGH
ncbi:MAG: hypothetical protein VKI83_05630 [Synechococcaceae cyanobacterium]|nr:hypothetical protein [Synechococcaceae cyanobacterium]